MLPGFTAHPLLNHGVSMRDQRKAAGWATLSFLTSCGPLASERCWDPCAADGLGYGERFRNGVPR